MNESTKPSLLDIDFKFTCLRCGDMQDVTVRKFLTPEWGKTRASTYRLPNTLEFVGECSKCFKSWDEMTKKKKND